MDPPSPWPDYSKENVTGEEIAICVVFDKRFVQRPSIIVARCDCTRPAIYSRSRSIKRRNRMRMRGALHHRSALIRRRKSPFHDPVAPLLKGITLD